MTEVDNVQAAIDQLEQEGLLVPGMIIEHAWIDAALKLNKNDVKYPFLKMRDFGQLKTRLLKERNIDLKTMPGTGYRIVPSEDQVLTAMVDTGKSIGKAIEKGLDRVTYVDLEKLSDAGRKDQLEAQARLSSLQGMSRRHVNMNRQLDAP